MNRICYFLIFFFLVLSVNAQKFNLDKVTVNELTEKTNPIDTSAAAAILFKKANLYIELDSDGYEKLFTVVEIKIKIYKKEGYKYADFEKAFYTGARSDKVAFSNLATYNLVDGKIVKTKLKDDDYFLEKRNKYYDVKKITLPNVKVGSIIEFKYIHTTHNLSEFERFYFEYEIPAKYVEYKVDLPDGYIYNKTLYGNLTPEQKEEIVDHVRSGSISRRTTFSMTNIKPIVEEQFVNNIDNYRSSINHEFSYFFKRDEKNDYASNWETVTKRIYENENFGGQLEKKDYFEKDLEALLIGLSTNEEKTEVVFNYIKNRMSWNYQNGYLCEDGVKLAYKNRVGNVAEINLILITMLRYAGIEANPIILSTRKNGVKLYPSRTAFNYVIAGVELLNKVVLLDATDKYSLPNIMPIRNLNWKGRIIRKNMSSAEIDLVPTTYSIKSTTVFAQVNNDAVVSGKVRNQYFDYNAFLFREENSKLSKQSILEKIEKKYNELEVFDYEIQNSEELVNPIIESYTFKSNNSVEIISDKMYVAPLLFFTLTENPFKQESRKYPVDFVFPYQQKFNVSLKIPEGYSIEKIPDPKAIAMPDNLGSMKYNISTTGNQVQLLYTFEINQAIIASEYYEALKNFYKEMINKQTEKIVLKKA